ncbi:hypothetical protein L218DRAFT_946811 [Marasmius fiardii PR-910]|nr:hypothetical protein L218DRAFT_946811 [Marasmius fiardii PR-910]
MTTQLFVIVGIFSCYHSAQLFKLQDGRRIADQIEAVWNSKRVPPILTGTSQQFKQVSFIELLSLAITHTRHSVESPKGSGRQRRLKPIADIRISGRPIHKGEKLPLDERIARQLEMSKLRQKVLGNVSGVNCKANRVWVMDLRTGNPRYNTAIKRRGLSIINLAYLRDERIRSFPLFPPPPSRLTRLTMTPKLALSRVCFIFPIFLFMQKCTGFNITVPPELETTVGNSIIFQWAWNYTNFQQSPSGAFIAMLIKNPGNFTCGNLVTNKDTVSNVVESFAVNRIPASIPSDSDASGSFVLSPKTSGFHVICTYGNSSISNLLVSLEFLDQSITFNVLPAPTSTAPSPSSTQSNKDESHKTPIAQIAGGAIGGVALVCFMLAIIIYQRIKYKRKLIELSNEHLLQQQLSPTPFLSTLIPRRPKKSRRSEAGRSENEISAGSEEATINQLSPPTYARTNPPSYSAIDLPNEHALLQHPEKRHG